MGKRAHRTSMGASRLMAGGRRPRSVRDVGAATVVIGALAAAGVLALAGVLRAPVATPRALLGVRGMEREARLEQHLSQHLAAQELAHWAAINAKVFPHKTHVEARAAAHPGPVDAQATAALAAERARAAQARVDKAAMSRLLAAQRAEDHAQLQQALRQQAQKAAPANTDSKDVGSKAAPAAQAAAAHSAKNTPHAAAHAAVASAATKGGVASAGKQQVVIPKGQKLGVANDDAFLEMNPPLNPPEQYDPFANMDPPGSKKSGRSTLKLEPEVEAASATKAAPAAQSTDAAVAPAATKGGVASAAGKQRVVIPKAQKLGVANDDAFLEMNPPLNPPEQYDPFANMDPPGSKKSGRSTLKLEPQVEVSAAAGQRGTQKKLHVDPKYVEQVERRSAHRQKKLQPAGPVEEDGKDEEDAVASTRHQLGDDVMDMANTSPLSYPATDDGDVHVPADAAAKAAGYMFFKSKTGQQILADSRRSAVLGNGYVAPHPDGSFVQSKKSDLEGVPSVRKLGDDVMDMHNSMPLSYPATDDGDVHVPGNAVEQYMFKQKQGQRLFLGEGAWVHVPVEHEMAGDGVGGNFEGSKGVAVDSDPMTPEAQDRVNGHRRPPCRYQCGDPAGCDGHPGLTDGDCEETPFMREWDIEAHAWPDKYPASFDAWTGNNHGLFKSNAAQQLAGRMTDSPATRRRQRLFLGEGAWVHVPVEGEMAGDGVGGNFDGANGVVVNSDAMSADAQDRVASHARPPCSYRCASPSGWCKGHLGLTSGDCEETVGFEHDVLHTPMDHSYYPATFGAWSENPTNSDFFKQTGGQTPSLAAMAAAQFRAQEAADKEDEPAGLASLARPRSEHGMQERKAPGLGALAPTVGRIGLASRRRRTSLTARPWRASEAPVNPRHVQGNGSLGEDYIDMPSNAMNNENEGDVSVDVDQIVPYMYKAGFAKQQRLAAASVQTDATKAPLTMLAEKVAAGDVWGPSDSQVSVVKLKQAVAKGDARWDKLVDKSSHKLSNLQARASVTRSTLENVDGARELPVGEYRTHAADEAVDDLPSKVVDVQHADCTSEVDCAGHTWQNFLFKHRQGAKGGAMLATRKKRAFVPAHELEEPALDGMADDVVTVQNGKVDDAKAVTLAKFLAAPAESVSGKIARGMLAQPAADQGNGTKPLGDEYLDSADQVHVATEKTHTGKHAGEQVWPSFFEGARGQSGNSKGTKEKGAVKQAGRVGLTGATAVDKGSRVGLSSSDALDDINTFYDTLDDDPVHGSLKYHGKKISMVR